MPCYFRSSTAEERLLNQRIIIITPSNNPPPFYQPRNFPLPARARTCENAVDLAALRLLHQPTRGHPVAATSMDSRHKKRVARHLLAQAPIEILYRSQRPAA